MKMHVQQGKGTMGVNLKAGQDAKKSVKKEGHFNNMNTKSTQNDGKMQQEGFELQKGPPLKKDLSFKKDCPTKIGTVDTHEPLQW